MHFVPTSPPAQLLLDWLEPTALFPIGGGISSPRRGRTFRRVSEATSMVAQARFLRLLQP